MNGQSPLPTDSYTLNNSPTANWMRYDSEYYYTMFFMDSGS